MNQKQTDNISRFLSLVLRHQPEKIGLTLDAQGWAEVSELIDRSAAHSILFSREDLKHIVETNAKQRFTFNQDGSRIRANQGHSVEVDLQLTEQQPPEVLYHGTVEKFIAAIRAEGLKRMSRQHVHLSPDRATAQIVGSRRGKAIILTIRSGEMHANGIKFYRSDNGVWLTDTVPPAYIEQ